MSSLVSVAASHINFNFSTQLSLSPVFLSAKIYLAYPFTVSYLSASNHDDILYIYITLYSVLKIFHEETK